MSTEKINSIIANLAIEKTPMFGWLVRIHGEYMPLCLIEDYDLLMAMSNNTKPAPFDYIQQLGEQLKYVGQKKGSGRCHQQGLDKLDKIKEELTQLFNNNQVSEAVLINGVNSGVMTMIPGYGKFRLVCRNEDGETAELIATLDECVETFVRRFS